MADDTHTQDDRHEDGRVELLETPPDAKMLTTLGMAKKTPGWCACGEHREDGSEGPHRDH